VDFNLMNVILTDRKSAVFRFFRHWHPNSVAKVQCP
jgi:hypothetical protein